MYVMFIKQPIFNYSKIKKLRATAHHLIIIYIEYWLF